MEFINSLFSGPVLPATLFLSLMLLWSLLALAGTVDLDVPAGDLDLDVDLDVDLDGAAGGPSDGLAILMVKWLNLRDVPLVLWMAVLAVVWWFFSALLWHVIDLKFFTNVGWLGSSLLVARNLALAIPLTKLATQPMRGWFVAEKIDAQSLIGKECRISSSAATPEFGQVKFKTDGAPLLLNVRTDGEHLAQGTPVWITHYDSQRRIYIVSPTTTGRPATDSTTSSKG